MSVIYIADGPAGGRTFDYPEAPKVVVIAEKWDGRRLLPKYHDYQRIGLGCRYRHSPTCFQCRQVARPA